jgi:endoglucanase
MTASRSMIRTSGSSFLGPEGEPLLLRGVCLGGWLNMENFITGYSANETLMRREVRRVIGDDRAERFFERLLTRFFDEPDARFLGEAGLNLARIAVSYKHFEDDARPLKIKLDGFRHLDRAINTLASYGVYSIIDLHALPGSQNHHWHSDNPTHVPAFWEHRDFQDRVVNIWEAIADHYKGNTWVAGYNLLNEPADESRSVVGPFYRRLVSAIRAVDPDHTVFLDGNTYATEFDIFDEPFDNAVYTLHDYVDAGLGRSPHYSREEAEQKFLKRSAYARATETPILVGEFGPIYTANEAEDARLRGILADQLALYQRHSASWALWMYKDIGRQGLVSVRPDTPYRRRFDDFVA